jgi:probable HAF family extracellular repeat protein
MKNAFGISFAAIAALSLVALTTIAAAGGLLPRQLGSATAPRVVDAVVNDINDRGQIVGGVTARDGLSRGFLWDNGTVTLLGRGRWASASGINDRGQVIGRSSSASGAREYAVVWRSGRMTNVGFAYAEAINDRGQIIGVRKVAVPNGFMWAPVLWEAGRVRDLWSPRAGSVLPYWATALDDHGRVVGEDDGRAVLWQDGEITDLGPGTPVAINERGQIAGYSQTATGEVRAFLWQQGTRTDLGPGTPVAINGYGQIVGDRWTGSILHAVLWHDGTTTDLGTLGGSRSFATAISDRGQIVGASTDVRGVQHGFVWQNGTMTRLPSPTGYARTRAVAINDRNQIAGDGCFDDCERRAPWARGRFAVLWTLRPGEIDTRLILGAR